jgi:hypothetical protein
VGSGISRFGQRATSNKALSALLAKAKNYLSNAEM